MDILQKNDRYDYYDICRKFLLYCGQWPHQKLGQRLFCMGLIVIWDLTIITVQVANYFVCETVECILQTIPMNMVAIIAMVKLLTCYFNMQKMKVLIEHLDVDWNIVCCEEEFDIMKKYAETGRWYALLYTTYVYIVTISFGSTVLLPRVMDVVSPLERNESRPIILPCPAYYFVDETKYFYYIYLHLQLGAVICITGVIAHDCNFFTFVEHVCGLFAIVGFRFEHLLYRRNITHLSHPSDNMYFKNIVFAIQAHKTVLQFIVLLENAFSTSFALQILIVVIGMSTSLIQISTELHGDLAEVVRYVLFVIGQLIHLLILNFQGQQLINQSHETHLKIYNGLWYEIPVKSQRMLLFTMRKSIEVSYITAGKIYIFCLESFTSIMQCSVSYFTVLSSFNEP